jgi:hypothetical protein
VHALHGVFAAASAVHLLLTLLVTLSTCPALVLLQMLLGTSGQKLDPVVVCSTLLPLIASEDTLLSSVSMEALACLHKLQGPSQLQQLLRSAGASELLIATVLQANIQNFLPSVTSEGLVGHRLVPQRGSQGGSELGARESRSTSALQHHQLQQTQQQAHPQSHDELQGRVFVASKLPWEVNLPQPKSQDMTEGRASYSSRTQGGVAQDGESISRWGLGERGAYDGYSSGVSATALRAAVSTSGRLQGESEGGLADTLRAARSATAPQRLLQDLAAGGNYAQPQQQQQHQQLVTNLGLLGLNGTRSSSSSNLFSAHPSQEATSEPQQSKKASSITDYNLDVSSSYKTQRELEAAGEEWRLDFQLSGKTFYACSAKLVPLQDKL